METVETADTFEAIRPMIQPAILAIMKKIGAIAKKKKHFLGFYYRGIDDVMNEVSPALLDNDVTMSTEVVSHEVSSTVEKQPNNKDKTVYHAKLTIRVIFTALDGSTHTAMGASEGSDNAGDLATDKAMSCAIKQALIFGLCIPIEEDDLIDPHSEYGAAMSDVERDARSRIKTCTTVEQVTALRKRVSANSINAFEPGEVESLRSACDTRSEELSSQAS